METTLFVLIAVIVGSVVLTTTVYARQQNLERLRNQTKKSKDNAATAELIFTSLANIGCDPKLLNLLARVWIAHLKQAKGYSPQDLSVDSLLETARSEIKQTLTEKPAISPPMSDDGIRRAQGCINKALTNIIRLQKHSDLDASEVIHWSAYLKQRFVDVAVEAHLAQAERCLQENQKSTAAGHYRIAQHQLQHSTVHESDVKERIDAIKEKAEAIFATAKDGTELAEDGEQQIPEQANDSGNSAASA